MPDTVETYSETNTRIFIFYYIFAFMFLVLLLALGYRQIYLYDKYSKAGERQTLRRLIKPGARGDIYDRNGKILVGNVPVFSAVIYTYDIKLEFYNEYMRIKREKISKKEKIIPHEISPKARENVIQRHMDEINKILGTNYEFDTKKFNKNYSRTLLPIPLISNLTQREHAILSERLSVNSSVKIVMDTARYYPYKWAAAQTLGYVLSGFERIEEDAPGEGLMTFTLKGKIGQTGIEGAFEDYLAGKTGIDIWVVDINSDRFENITSMKSKKGGNIYSSIDIDLQLVAEEALGDRKGAVVALDVESGEVLVMASRPSYDLNSSNPRFSFEDFEEIKNSGALYNKATRGHYPPGSTFKLITAIAGLESGAITLDTVSHCTGSFMLGNRALPCNSRWGHGYVNLCDAIAQSCNVFFYENGLKTGVENLSNTAKLFGLDSKSGIEIGDLGSSSIVPTPAFKKKREYGPWVSGDTTNMAIGQGLLQQTPLQMACFVASLARKETRTRPSIIHDSTKELGLAYHDAQKLNISDENYAAIIKGMEDAVLKGTAKRAAVNGIRIAAKTGTAQVPVHGQTLNLAWTVAFAPVENPKIAIAVMVEGEEIGDVGGGKTAGPVVQKVFEKYFEALKKQ